VICSCWTPQEKRHVLSSRAGASLFPHAHAFMATEGRWVRARYRCSLATDTAAAAMVQVHACFKYSNHPFNCSNWGWGWRCFQRCHPFLSAVCPHSSASDGSIRNSESDALAAACWLVVNAWMVIHLPAAGTSGSFAWGPEDQYSLRIYKTNYFRQDLVQTLEI